MKILKLLTFLILVLSASAAAQIATTSGKTAVTLPIVKNAPYYAEAVSENTKVLPNGNKIIQTGKEKTYRDSQGRTRRESENALGKSIQRQINIKDPTAGFEYFLNPLTKTAFRMPIKEMFIAIRKTDLSTDYSFKRETLPKQTFEGLEVTVNRIVTTIAPGTVGNEQPLETITETWFSPELKIIVMSKRNDPRVGNSKYQMESIKREEPAAELFEIPSDYKIVEQFDISDRFFRTAIQ